MKKRRTIIISLLLVAALALGIGYANLTVQLEISGDASLSYDPNACWVEFTSASIVEHDSDENPLTGSQVAQALITGGSVEGQGNKIEFDVYNLKHLNDHAKLNATLQNNSASEDIVATLSAVTVSTPKIKETSASAADYLTITWKITWTDGEGDHTLTNESDEADYADLTLEYGETASIEVKVNLDQGMDEAINITDIDVYLDFTGEVVPLA